MAVAVSRAPWEGGILVLGGKWVVRINQGGPRRAAVSDGMRPGEGGSSFYTAESVGIAVLCSAVHTL